MNGCLKYIYVMINVYDLETYKDEKNNVIPFCLCMIINNKMYDLYISENDNIIINSLNIIALEIKTNLVEIYIHNLNFDGMIIINELTKNKIKFNIFSIKTNIYYIEVLYLNKIIKFRCSFKLINTSLKNMGYIEKFEKKYFPYNFVNKNTLYYVGEIPNKNYWNKDDFEKFIEIWKEDKYDLKRECIKYCRDDVILTKKILENLFKILEEEKIFFLLKKCYSSASLSYNVFFKKYNIKKIENNLKKSEEDFIRNSYFGGRCEVFGNLNENEHIKYYDFSGMYGQCMMEEFHNGIGQFYITNDYTIPGFHTIEYISNFEYIPILPSHSENKKLMFTNGKKIGTFWFEEIKLFVKKGGIVLKVIMSYVYNKYEEVFTDFIKKFNLIKEKGGYYKIFGKLMINSFYGGMGLKPESDITYITFSEKEYLNIIENFNINMECKLNSVYIIVIKNDYKYKKIFKNKIIKNEFSKRNVSYSSAIASKARIKLFNAIEEVIEDGGRILYCDTDSIFAAYNKKDKREYFNKKKWLNFYEDGVFVTSKTYALKLNSEEEIKIKGINLKEISFNDIKEKFYNETDIIFNNQLIFNRKNFDLKQSYMSKKIVINQYDKRKFIENKKNTIPIYHTHVNG